MHGVGMMSSKFSRVGRLFIIAIGSCLLLFGTPAFAMNWFWSGAPPTNNRQAPPPTRNSLFEPEPEAEDSAPARNTKRSRKDHPQTPRNQPAAESDSEEEPAQTRAPTRGQNTRPPARNQTSREPDTRETTKEGPTSQSSGKYRSLWCEAGERQRWTAASIKCIQQNWSKLQQARDINRFCSGYNGASQFAKENCWLLIVGATVKFESSFRPHTTAMEPAPLNYNSVGLLQLSHNSRAKECVQEGARSEADLKKAELNLCCGIRIMSNQVAKHKSLGGRRGAGAYWSVLRNSGEHRNAKADQIAGITQREFRQVSARGGDRSIASQGPRAVRCP